MRRYTDRYEYDEVGNFKFMRHVADAGNWTRSYEYEAASLIEPAKKNNRLTKTTVGNGINLVENYTYVDPHGNDVQGCMTAINSMKIAWDFKDQLQQVDLGGGGKAFYVCDAAGQRVRKVIETQNGARKQERIYIGGLEVYREYNASATTVTLERETLHIMDDKQSIALSETQTIENSNLVNAPVPVQRYHLANHLGSVSVELAEDGALISYEEYCPYGTTGFQAGRSAAEVSVKRYRYTVMERDEESGFCYHGARYYLPWLARWTACDPKGISPGINVYRYTANRPTVLIDPNGTQECTASPFVCDPKFYKEPKTAAPTPVPSAYGQLSPLSKGGVTTTTHEDVKSDAGKYTASSMVFGFTDIAKWKSDPEYLMKFKAQFVYENREVIKAAAAKYDLPAELVAGVAFVEIGGKDPIKSTVYWGRSWIPGTDDKDKTSLGQQATQVRRAAESLGYDPKTLTDAQRTEIVKSLNDPAHSIFIAAKHLSDLRNIDVPGKAGKDLTTDEIKVIGARYNQGPDKPLADVRKDLSYGQSITKRWTELGNLLATAPPKLDYSPVQNNIVKPANSWFGKLDWEIRRLYGVP
jgi:RHS repeat-associated protein